MTPYAIILAGGSGTRFWPYSRTTYPKQFLALDGPHSLLQNTVRRVTPLIPPERVLVVTAGPLQTQTHAQLPELPPGNILSEPVGRNTAPAIGLAAFHLNALDPDAAMVVLPADHVIPDSTAFCVSIRHALEAAQQHDVLMTLGIHPAFPATGYGYIEAGPCLPSPPGIQAYRVRRFIEKPSAEQAGHLIASGRCYWNCGIFVWPTTTILDELQRHLPDLWQGLKTYMDAQQAGAGTEVLTQRYTALRSISIDYGVLEHSSRVGVLPVTFAWSDVGSWRSLADLRLPDSDGNVVIGQHLGRDSTGLIVYSPDALTATIGLSDLIIVRLHDALLICPKDRDQEVRDLVDMLRQHGQTDYL